MRFLSSVGDFWLRFSTHPRRILLSDYDGTLAPFRIKRDQALPYPKIRETLNSILQAKSCRVVIISGRRTEDLLPLLGLKQKPEIWGSHGIERLYPDGRYELAELDKDTESKLIKAETWMRTQGWQELCERKPAGLALHWRGLSAEKIQELKTRVSAQWSRIAAGTGLDLLAFDGGLELRPAGRNKGDAVKAILAEEGPETIAAYLGDDLTDEDAFAALAGKGLGVLVSEKLRPTKADLWLRPPEELLNFLQKWAESCEG